MAFHVGTKTVFIYETKRGLCNFLPFENVSTGHTFKQNIMTVIQGLENRQRGEIY
jgi:hypothetical protein